MKTELGEVLDLEENQQRFKTLFKIINIGFILFGCITNILLYISYSIHASGTLITTPNPPVNIPETPLMKNIYVYFLTLNILLIICWIFIQNLKKQKS